VVQDGIDVGNDTVIRGCIDSFLEILLSTPFSTLVSLLVKLSQIPDVVAAISLLQANYTYISYPVPSLDVSSCNTSSQCTHGLEPLVGADC